jgi:hypothetical protein
VALSADSAKVVDRLEKHIIELHAEWKMLLELFGTSAERSAFLGTVAGVFFDTVYRTFLRDILLGISRLTDPLSTAGRDNLVLERLRLLPEVSVDTELSCQVAATFAEIKSAASNIRAYRNKYLAHLDLPASLRPDPEVLPGIKRKDIDTVLERIAALFNLIEQKLRDSTTIFSLVGTHPGPQALLLRLEDAEAFRLLPAEERYRLRQSSPKAGASG